jgi:hypothetical protein
MILTLLHQADWVQLDRWRDMWNIHSVGTLLPVFETGVSYCADFVIVDEDPVEAVSWAQQPFPLNLDPSFLPFLKMYYRQCFLTNLHLGLELLHEIVIDYSE